MDTIGAFLAMGGYAAYVWPAYAVALIVLLAVALASLRELRAAETALAEAERGHEGRRRRGPASAGKRHDDA